MSNQFATRATHLDDTLSNGAGCALVDTAPSQEWERSLVAALSEPIDEMLPEQEALLSEILNEALAVAGGIRGFIALIDLMTGELALRMNRGEGWDEARSKARVPISQQLGQGITVQVATTGKPYRCGDVSVDPYYIPFFPDVQSELAVPMVDLSGRTIGVLNVESTKLNAFDENQERHLAALATRAALALSLAQHQAREKALIEIGKGLSSENNPHRLTEKITRITREILPAEDCSIFLYNPKNEELTLAASSGPLAKYIDEPVAAYGLGIGLTGWIGQHRQSIRIVDPSRDPRWRGLYMELPPEELGAFLGVPICGHEALLGVLRAVRRRRSSQAFIPDAFTEADEDILRTLASQIAVAIENAELMKRVIGAERMAALGEMSARTAHMIGNAIFGIKGHINELEYQSREETPGREALMDLVNDIKNGIFRVEGMLQEFRNFVRSDQMKFTAINLNEVIRHSLDSTFCSDADIGLTVDLSEDLPSMEGDPAKLQSAFSELIENSLVEQSGGGELRISTEWATTKDVHEGWERVGSAECVKIVFADKGRGIRDDTKERVFEPFYSTKSQGMGLGLSIVKGIIASHHGIIKEMGHEGSGAEFVILLPVKQGLSDASPL